MSEKILFRGSHSGNCIRQLVAAHLDPDSLKPDPIKEPFLADGHHLQVGVTEFLREQGVEVQGVEYEGVREGRLWRCVGHVDGYLPHARTLGVAADRVLLEVKMVTEDYFDKLKDTDWRIVYSKYPKQAQSYQTFKQLTLRGNTIPGPFDATVFIFGNRNKSLYIGGMPLDHPAYTYDPAMVEVHDPEIVAAVDAQFDRAAEYVQRGEMPEECDAPGWCFYCQQYGSGEVRQRGGKKVFVMEEDFPGLGVAAQAYDTARDEKKAAEAVMREQRKIILGAFDKFDASDLEVEDPEGKVFKLKVSEFESLYPDKETVTTLVENGTIPRVAWPQSRLNVKALAKQEEAA